LLVVYVLWQSGVIIHHRGYSSAVYAIRLLCETLGARSDFEALGWSTSTGSGVVVPDVPAVLLGDLGDAPMTDDHAVQPHVPVTLEVGCAVRGLSAASLHRCGQHSFKSVHWSRCCFRAWKRSAASWSPAFSVASSKRKRSRRCQSTTLLWCLYPHCPVTKHPLVNAEVSCSFFRTPVWSCRDRSIRKSNPEVFQSTALYAAVCELLCAYEYPLSARRVLHNLFDKVSFASQADWQS
jgi:hypothetical protein